MLVDISVYTEPLSRTPTLLRAVVAGRPDEWLDSRHDPEVVSPRVAVAHLLICEADPWITRLRRVLEPGREFPPGPYDDMRASALAAERSLDSILDEFDSLKMWGVGELERMELTTEDLEKTLVFDDEDWSETVGDLLNTWVAHDLYHVGQIFKSYSVLYVGKIGQYQEFLNLPHFN